MSGGVIWSVGTIITSLNSPAAVIYVILLPIPDSLGGEVFGVKPDDRCSFLEVSCRAPNAQSNGAVISAKVQPVCFAVK